MTLEDSMRGLLASVERLQEALNALRVTVIEDEPSPPHALATNLGYVVTDACGSADEAVTSLREGVDAVTDRGDVHRAYRALASSHEQVQVVAKALLSQLSYDEIEQLVRLGRELGGEWQPWGTTVRRALAHCEEELRLVSDGIVACWRETADTLAARTFSVNATNIGQHVTLTAEYLAEGRT